MSMRPAEKLLASRTTRSEHGGRLTATAGGAGDNTATALQWVDRFQAARGPFHGAKLVLVGRATLAASATLTLTAQVRDATSVVGAGAADVGTAVAFGVVATGAVGGSTELFTAEIDVDLMSLREFVGVTVTGDLSAGSVDTADISAVWVFSGSDRGPISKATTIRGQ
jgi:hypothetical protein